MSPSSIPGCTSNENPEEAPPQPSVVQQIETPQQGRSRFTRNSIIQRFFPSTLNGFDIPIIDGIDPLAEQLNYDERMNTVMEFLPVLSAMQESQMLPPEYTIDPQDEWTLTRTPSEARSVQASSNNALPTTAAMTSSSAQQATTLASEGIDGQDFQRPLLPFPYSEPWQRQAPEQRMQQEQQERRERQQRQQREQQEEDQHQERRRETDAPFPYSNHPQTSILSLPQALQQRDEERRGELQRRRILQDRETLPQTAEHSRNTPFPYSNHPRTSILSLPQQAPQLQPAARQDPIIGVAAAAERTIVPALFHQSRPSPAAIPSTSYTASSSLANSPVRYQNLPRAHNLLDFLLPPTPRELQRAPAPAQVQAQTEPTPNALLSTPNRRHTGIHRSNFPLAELHAQIESEIAHAARNPDHPVTANTIISSANAPSTAARNAAAAATEAEERTLRRAHRARRSPSLRPAEPIRVPRPDTDHRFRHLLSRVQHRAALPTPPSRPLHWLPGRDALAEAGRTVASERMWGRLRAEAVAASAMMASGTHHSTLTRGSHAAGVEYGSTAGRLSIAHTPRPSNPHVITLSPSRTTTTPASHSPHTRNSGPPPLTREVLERYAHSPTFNPSSLPWHSLTLLTQIQHHRLHAAAEARARIRARRQQVRSARRRALALRHQLIRDAIHDAERVRHATTNLALCGALSDSRPFLHALERADEERITDSRSVRRRERERGRGWVPSERIVTPTERYELRNALARRDALGVRMGVDGALEAGLGPGLGRWMFDVWVAGAARGVGGGGWDGEGGRVRVGAVWLGPPGGNAGEMDVDGDSDGDGLADVGGRDGHADEGIRQFHFIPDDGEAADGVGEGWVEWREPGQGMGQGRFVVHDVFRFAEEGGMS